jgi:hypothetical protein
VKVFIVVVRRGRNVGGGVEIEGVWGDATGAEVLDRVLFGGCRGSLIASANFSKVFTLRRTMYYGK